MQTVKTIGLDIAKSVFQAGVDAMARGHLAEVEAAERIGFFQSCQRAGWH